MKSEVQFCFYMCAHTHCLDVLDKSEYICGWKVGGTKKQELKSSAEYHNILHSIDSSVGIGTGLWAGRSGF
jgi:hypothetical protein